MGDLADHDFPCTHTGFNEPNALAIIANDGSGDNHIFHLYVREKDPKAELWDGARSGTQAAVDVFNADEVGDTYRGAVRNDILMVRITDR